MPVSASTDIVRRPPALTERLRIRQLQVIVAIADQRSLLAASRTLGISQPALSKTLQEIEAVLGVRIFDRVSRGDCAECLWPGDPHPRQDCAG
jgi:LysR family pca operon transcriptional activator